MKSYQTTLMNFFYTIFGFINVLELVNQTLGMNCHYTRPPYKSPSPGDSFSFHDESRSSTCWIEFHRAADPMPEQERGPGAEDKFGIIPDIPCKRSAVIRDASRCDEWRNHYLYYAQEPYGLQGVWVFEITTYSD